MLLINQKWTPTYMWKLITFVLLAMIPWGWVRAADVTLLPEPARSADDFADSVGICTHFNYGDTMYGTRHDQVVDLLEGSGIRYVRDSLHSTLDQLYQSHGIRAILVADPRLGPPAELAKGWIEHRAIIAAIEGPNEANQF